VKLEGWDEKDKTWELEEKMSIAKELVKQDSKEIGGRPKAKRKRYKTRYERDVCVFIRVFCFFKRFSEMIVEGSDVGGQLWSWYSVALLHRVQLCGISAALRKTCVSASSSEMSGPSSITFTSQYTERLFAHTYP
jgi:hypothetical protein